MALAFDCVNHGILLAKLNYFQETGKKLVQIRSYLIDRKQTTTKIKSSSEIQNISWTGEQQNMELPVGQF